MIGLSVTERDKEGLSRIITSVGFKIPNIKISIYKNRRGRWKDILLWCYADKGICRYDPMFATTYNYELIDDLEDLDITVS